MVHEKNILMYKSLHDNVYDMRHDINTKLVILALKPHQQQLSQTLMFFNIENASYFEIKDLIIANDKFPVSSFPIM